MRRIFASIIAIIGWSALVIQFWLMVTGPSVRTVGFTESIVRYFSYFTILSNIIVAVTATAVAFLPRLTFFQGHSVQAAAAVYITIVGIVYSLFLRTVWPSVSLAAVADHALHDVVPIAYVVYWLVFAPKSLIAWADPIKWLSFPLVYILYSLIRGALVNWYPYWFVDISQIGYASGLLNTAFVLAGFIVTGYIFAGIAKIMVRSAAST